MECNVEAFLMLSEKATTAFNTKNYMDFFYFGELSEMCSDSLGLNIDQITQNAHEKTVEFLKALDASKEQ